MLQKVFASGLDVTALQNLRQTIMDMVASGASEKISVSRMHRFPENAAETKFVRSILRFFWSSGLGQFYRQTYEREPLLLLEHCTIRVQQPQPDGNYVPWHLDANFYGFGVPMLTAWVPLVDVGTTAPGLEFADISGRLSDSELRRIWTSLKTDELGRRSLNDQGLEELFGRDVRRRPVAIKTGGFCIFDQTVLHRTQVMPDATETRMAIEFRIADRDNLPSDVLPRAFKGMLMSWTDPDSGKIQVGYAGALFPQVAHKDPV